MGTKRIADLTETTTPLETSDMVIETTTGFTLKTKISNLMKRLFSFDDVYDDYLISINATQAPSGNSKPDLVEFRNGIYSQVFGVGAQPTEVFFVRHILHDIKKDSDLTFHVHWANNEATPTGAVKWNIDYTIARGYGVGTFGIPVTVSSVQTVGAQYVHMITDDDDMTINGTGHPEVEPDSIIVGRIWRDTNDIEDTFVGDAFLLHADVHFTKARVGTKERNRPFTSGGF